MCQIDALPPFSQRTTSAGMATSVSSGPGSLGPRQIEFFLLAADSIIAIVTDPDALGVSADIAVGTGIDFAIETVAELRDIDPTTRFVRNFQCPQTRDEVLLFANDLIRFVRGQR